MRIRIILIRIQIRIQDVKKFVTDPDPGRTLIRIWIWIQAKTIRILIRIQQKRTKYQENLLKVMKKISYPMFCWCIILNNHLSINVRTEILFLDAIAIKIHS